ncbi:MAG: GYD domain-containing protein [Acidimicrobiia bacterium]|jgi:uncharacterized protein with GYD domain
MPTYLLEVSYSVEGTKGLLKEGGSSRRETITKMIEHLGGKVEAFYYTFGEDDCYVITELPDETAAAAVSLNVGASGAASITTKVLIAPEVIDAASKTDIGYRAPGK